MNNYDLIVIGAGAAGLTAAIAFLREAEARQGGAAHCEARGEGIGGAGGGCADARVLLLDANGEPGKKILATGNGRCNLSNTSADGWRDTKDFFQSTGVLLCEDEGGRVYPQSRQAAAVRDALVREAVRLGAEILCETRVAAVSEAGGGGFCVKAERSGEPKTLSKGVRRAGSGAPEGRGEPRVFSAKRVIVATGGKACPAYGNFGDGYAIARGFGIEVNPIRPALVPFVYEAGVKERFAALAGVRAKAKVELLARLGGDGGTDNGGGGGDGADNDGGGGAEIGAARIPSACDAACDVIASSEGEVQFASYGLSGICVFDLSRYYTGGGGHAIRIDLAPMHAEHDIAGLLASGRAAGLAGVVHSKIAEYIERNAGDAIAAAALVKRLTVPVSGTKGWKEAQITAGGVSLGEVHMDSYEAKKTPGLYFAGEALDYDGASGGYNLDFAWNSGMKAGRAAAATLS
ncbi:MAG: NAD(P)/FAD-dependent oxidoreductase [Clostridiales Family XIII bacterium]|jgi:predicted flavoprotein YhiN|nr:NAD(P)/FAD-dependent oxidoreductase [Clostridiales Family XIII bacterium]